MGLLLLYLLWAEKEISIHPPRMGWDQPTEEQLREVAEISIHPPRMGWDLMPLCSVFFAVLISIHPPRMGWDEDWMKLIPLNPISIHPPRMGWDVNI